jgi:L-lactate dehydrogenase complex protein LldF
MSQVIRIHPAEEFKARSRGALNDPGQRKNFRGAMDFLQAKRSAQFPDQDELASLRELGASIRRYSLAHLPQLLEQLETNLVANGVQVHWAQNAEEANAIALGIARKADAKSIIKGKSMVSEEIEFNHAMEAAGLEAFESDMGEYIVQLADEKPSHIIMPAIHKTKQEIAKLFAARIPGVDYTEDVDALIQIGRNVLRRKFAQADIGLSGVNFAVAETGSLCLIENEGNGRMCTTVPRVHIAITGIEKVVQKLEHIAPLLSLLTRSATGQSITTYVNLISGRGAPDPAGQRPYPGLRRRAVACHAAMHPLRRLHEPLPCVRPHRRPCLWHHLPRPYWGHHLTPHAGPGIDLPAGLCVHAVWGLRRGVPGENSNP